MNDDIVTSEPSSTQSTHQDINQRILVVDDDARLRTLLQRFFGR